MKRQQLFQMPASSLSSCPPFLPAQAEIDPAVPVMFNKIPSFHLHYKPSQVYNHIYYRWAFFTVMGSGLRDWASTPIVRGRDPFSAGARPPKCGARSPKRWPMAPLRAAYCCAVHGCSTRIDRAAQESIVSAFTLSAASNLNSLGARFRLRCCIFRSKQNSLAVRMHKLSDDELLDRESTEPYNLIN